VRVRRRRVPGSGAGVRYNVRVDGPRHFFGFDSSAYESRTRTALDVFALLTLWVVAAPFLGSNPSGELVTLVLARLLVSGVFAVDYLIRLYLADRRGRFITGNVIALLAVFLPPVRILFSLRLLRAVFRQGNFKLFIVVASFLVLNGALIVFYLERDDPARSITPVADAFWWAAVTATTVGYGDVVPVTSAGRIVAVMLMFIGIVIYSMVTARVTSSFRAQEADGSIAGHFDWQAGDVSVDEATDTGVSTSVDPSFAAMEGRLKRIEHLLEQLSAGSDRDGPSGAERPA
jgi:voltage-gated potassium channel